MLSVARCDEKFHCEREREGGVLRQKIPLREREGKRDKERISGGREKKLNRLANSKCIEQHNIVDRQEEEREIETSETEGTCNRIGFHHVQEREREEVRRRREQEREIYQKIGKEREVRERRGREREREIAGERERKKRKGERETLSFLFLYFLFVFYLFFSYL